MKIKTVDQFLTILKECEIGFECGDSCQNKKRACPSKQPVENGEAMDTFGGMVEQLQSIPNKFETSSFETRSGKNPEKLETQLKDFGGSLGDDFTYDPDNLDFLTQTVNNLSNFDKSDEFGFEEELELLSIAFAGDTGITGDFAQQIGITHSFFDDEIITSTGINDEGKLVFSDADIKEAIKTYDTEMNPPENIAEGLEVPTPTVDEVRGFANRIFNAFEDGGDDQFIQELQVADEGPFRGETGQAIEFFEFLDRIANR